MGVSKAEGLRAAEEARSELYDTLTQLSDRLNYAKRFDAAVDRTQVRLKEEQKENPLGFALAVAGVAVAVGLVTWTVASKIVTKLR